MTAPTTQGGKPAPVTFSLNGLSAHDETLFKSFVRLLAHRTLQQWTFTPQSADVWVVAQAAANTVPPAQKALVVGHDHQGEAHFVSVPFHADALEQVLNHLGNIVAGEKHTTSSAPAADMPQAQFRLLRWPSAALLTSTDRMRLATMMTGKWTSMATLQDRSGVSAAVCSQFLADLQHAGLLVDFTQAQHTVTETRQHDTGAGETMLSPRNIEPGLISRIRSRLGIFSSGRT
ncbi:MAG: hypothetical protein V4573_15930 [Pseudomonadota bacterium]